MSPDSAPNEAAEALTPANYHPTFWADDDFVALKSEDVAVEASMVGFQHEELKKEVRKMLSTDAVTMGQKTRKLRLIDAVQRLGVSYHLESEIEAELSNMMKSGVDELVANDLESAALWFRLLRQQGFRVSPGDVMMDVLVLVLFFYVLVKIEEQVCSKVPHQQYIYL
ncbi:unnamed protein product [Linum tenue]|uniref:Terpene synthase N-terminal domain-containing protein n=1 Tax=Linum tenue TaxID=586396 RepID=A0AAV0LY44_9ROSI|nr:unnamed protein product [Linum tenue]